MYKFEITINGKKEKLEKKKLLTIGIITKNECGKLERCLKSLMPIKEALDCEIIVTDTGSSDNTIEMLSNYADKVINFEWCDDFSAARNTGVSESEGVWFMWLDSDEWIEDPQPLIDFFKSEDYKKYASASLKMIDYMDENYSKYNNLVLLRLAMLFENSKFEGRIHENMYRANPMKFLDLEVHHDGYVFENQYEKLKKHKRNLKNLMREYENTKESLSLLRYIVDQYRFNFEFEKSCEYCFEALKLTENKDFNYNVKAGYDLHFRIMLASNYLEMAEYEKAIQTLENIEIKDENTKHMFMDIYYILSVSYEKLEDIENCGKYARQYIELYIVRDSIRSDYDVIFFNTSERKEVIRWMLLNTTYDLKLNDEISKIGEYIELIRKYECSTNAIRGIENYISNVFAVIRSTNYYELIKILYNDETINNKYISVLEIENHILEFIKRNKINKEQFFREISDIEKNTPLIEISKYFEAEKLVQIEKAKNILIKNIKDCKDYPDQIKSELFYGVIKHNLESELLENLIDDIADVSKYLKSNIMEKMDFLKEILIYHKNYGSKDLKYQYIMTYIIEQSIFKFESEDMMLDVYEVLASLSIELMGKIYNKNNMSENTLYIYPPIFRFGFFINKANLKMEERDLLGYIKYLGKALRAYPIMEKPIKNIINNIQIKMDEEKQRISELEQLSKAIKQKIYELITLGNDNEAISVICQLQSIIPDDLELKELKSRITSK